MDAIETDRELAVYKAICRMPLEIRDIESLLEASSSELMVDCALDTTQIATLTSWLDSEIRRYKMSSLSSAHHYPSDTDLEKIF
jgi:hypothetical protein